MQIKAYHKMIYVLMMSLFLVGALIACSSPNDELTELNDNQDYEENNEIDPKGNYNDLPPRDVSDRNNNQPDDAEQNGNGSKLDHVNDRNVGNENEFGEHANNLSGVNEPSDDLDTDEANNKSAGTNANAQNDGDLVASPPQDESENKPTPDERPTLRSPVNSENDPKALTIGMFSLGDAVRNRTSFREAFTRRFEWDHPQVDIEFTTVMNDIFGHDDPSATLMDTTAALRKMITGNNPPDVLFLSKSSRKVVK